MFRVAICDDEQSICLEIEGIIRTYGQTAHDCLETEIFCTGEELCRCVSEGSYFDLVFLDIEMPLMSGVEVGHKIREEMDNQTTQIVYVSSRESYYRALFEVRPMNFINKPISADKIVNEVRKAQALAHKLQGLFSFKMGDETIKLPYKDIIWLESAGRRIRIVEIGGEAYFYGNLDKVQKELVQTRFMRIHRSYLINYDHVLRFRYTEVTMSNNQTITISKSHQKAIRGLQMEWDSKE